MTDDAAHRIRAFAAEAVSPARMPGRATGLRAIGWATVDLERAVAQLAGLLGLAEAAFVVAPPSAALGARCRAALGVGAGVLAGDVALVVLEPSTEARLAAALARWDEGPVAAWYTTGEAAEVAPAGRPAVSGPFGPEWLVGGDPLTGPHRLLVAAGTGTIPA